MKRFISIIVIVLLGIYFFGCEKSPVKPKEEVELDPTVEQFAAVGYNMNRIVNSSSEIAEVTNAGQFMEEDGSEGLPTTASLKKLALNLSSKAKVRCSKSLENRTESYVDSLLFFQDDTTKGIRKGLYYNAETGIARYYEVKYKFAAWQKLTYDSTEIVANLFYTLEDTLDDRMVRLYQLQLFDESFFVQKITNDVKVTDTKSREIVTGVEALKNAYYRSDRFLTHLTQFVDLNPDKSGELREDFQFKDGKSSYRHVIFRPDNTGEFSKGLRDGTVVSGSFNMLEDDGLGSFHEVTDYPEGRFIDKIEKSAEISITLPDSIVNLSYAETITYGSGTVTTDSARIITQDQFGVKTTEISYYKHDGEHGTLKIVENEGGSTLEGKWTTKENNFIIATAEYYLDGSGHLHFEVYQTEDDYNNNGNPILAADYYFSPDGSGTGSLSYQGQKYELSFNESGEAELSTDGKTSTVNLFQ